jgi:hypothetical protein
MNQDKACQTLTRYLEGILSHNNRKRLTSLDTTTDPCVVRMPRGLLELRRRGLRLRTWAVNVVGPSAPSHAL